MSGSRQTLSPFLIMTPTPELWPKHDHVVFLGEWCKKYAEKEKWEKYPDLRVCSPYEDPIERQQFTIIYRQVFASVLPRLTEALNQIHNRAYSIQFWEIMLGIWLRRYISVMHDRYMSLKSAIEQFPDFDTFVVQEAMFETPQDDADFSRLLAHDVYNHQLFSSIITRLSDKYYESRAVEYPDSPDRTPQKESFLSRLAAKSLHGLSILKKPKVGTYSPYYNKLTELKLYFRSKGEIAPITFPNVCSDSKRGNRLRAQLNEILETNYETEFAGIIGALLSQDLPMAYLEGFEERESIARGVRPGALEAVVTATGLWTNDAFKIWSGTLKSDGVQLIGVQHGGNYGISKYCEGEAHERSVCERYFSWGWEGERVVALPMNKMLSRQPKNRRKSSEILLGTTRIPRYSFEHSSKTPYDYERYHRELVDFLNHLETPLRNKVRVRLYPVDHEWCTRERLESSVDGVRIDSFSTTFYESMEDSALYIADHLSTTIIEAFAWGKPCLIFVNPDLDPVRESAWPEYNALRKVGVIHHSVEGAAKALSDIVDDVEGWWQDPERQQKVTAFREKFARTSEYGVEEWYRAIMGATK